MLCQFLLSLLFLSLTVSEATLTVRVCLTVCLPVCLCLSMSLCVCIVHVLQNSPRCHQCQSCRSRCACPRHAVRTKCHESTELPHRSRAAKVDTILHRILPSRCDQCTHEDPSRQHTEHSSPKQLCLSFRFSACSANHFLKMLFLTCLISSRSVDQACEK